MASSDDTSDSGARERARSLATTRQGVVRGLAIVVIIVFALFAIANGQPVDFSWLVGETVVRETPEGTTGGVPLIVLLTASFLLGAIVGAALMVARGRRRGTGR